MRWYVVLLVVAVGGCTPTWDRHQTQLAEAEARGDYVKALSEERWMIDNAFMIGPREEHSPEADAKRYLELARLAAKTGKYRLALDSLRQTLNMDPTQAAAVRRQLDALPFSPTERARLNREFAWNIAALQPSDDAIPPEVGDNVCWSYRVREIRILHDRTVSTEGGMQRQVMYDARVWLFDSDAQRWHTGGEWISEAGTETEWVNGASEPHYRALTATGSRFYTDGRVPPCHRTEWQGPYDVEHGTIFVAAQLPTAQ